jgi:hypothetical protein
MHYLVSTRMVHAVFDEYPFCILRAAGQLRGGRQRVRSGTQRYGAVLTGYSRGTRGILTGYSRDTHGVPAVLTDTHAVLTPLMEYSRGAP